MGYLGYIVGLLILAPWALIKAMARFIYPSVNVAKRSDGKEHLYLKAEMAATFGARIQEYET